MFFLSFFLSFFYLSFISKLIILLQFLTFFISQVPFSLYSCIKVFLLRPFFSLWKSGNLLNKINYKICFLQLKMQMNVRMRQTLNFFFRNSGWLSFSSLSFLFYSFSVFVVLPFLFFFLFIVLLFHCVCYFLFFNNYYSSVLSSTRNINS